MDASTPAFRTIQILHRQRAVDEDGDVALAVSRTASIRDTQNVAIDECHHFVLTHSHDRVSADSCIAAIPFRSSAEHDDIAADQRGFTARTGMEPLAIATDRVRHHGCLRTVAGRDPDRAR